MRDRGEQIVSGMSVSEFSEQSTKPLSGARHDGRSVRLTIRDPLILLIRNACVGDATPARHEDEIQHNPNAVGADAGSIGKEVRRQEM